MTISSLLEVAESQRGQGWLGAMEIIDVLNNLEFSEERRLKVKRKMQIEIGKIILSGKIGCDESAMAFACNQCIERVIKSECK